MSGDLRVLKWVSRLVTSFLSLLATVLLAGAQAHEGHSHGDAAFPAHPPSAKAPDPNRYPTGPAVPAAQTPIGPAHRGQVKTSWQHVVEVVYLPHQIQVYIYDSQRRPLNPQGVTGDVVLEVQGNPRQWWYRLEPSPTENCLIANVDVSRVRDSDMVAVFELRNLPHHEEPQIRFSQLFALTKAGPSIETSAYTLADRDAVQRQAVCPVTGGPFDHGNPIKVVIDGSPIYVCCEGCVEALKKDPARYLAGVRPSGLTANGQMTAADRPSLRDQGAVPFYQAGARVSVKQATYSEDGVAVARQRVCPVTGEQLGTHGAPYRMIIEGQSVYVCCEACVQEVQKDPLYFVSKPAPAQSGNQCSRQECSSCRTR